MSKKLSDQELEKFENNRDIWQEALDGIRQIKKGQHGRKIILEMLPIVETRNKIGLSQSSFQTKYFMEVRLKKEQKIKVESPEDIFKIMQQILMRENKIGRNKEHFWVIGLAVNKRILFIELVSLGHLTKAIVDPGEVFQLAILRDAPEVIFVHNRPSTEPKPSKADKDITDNLIQAGRIVNKKVVDHLIISETDYYSFSNSGLLDELRQSKKYVIKYLEEKRIREEGRLEGEKKGEERGVKKGKIEMAKAMKIDGEPTDKIVKYTQLSMKEIKKL